MLMAGKGEGLFDLIMLFARIIRMLVNGGAGGAVVLGVIGVAAVGGLFWWMGQTGEA